jgi:hypothetical protein
MGWSARILMSVAACLLALGGAAVDAGDAAGAYFTNERWGYKVRVPRGWTRAAMSADEEWIASKHLGKRPLEAKNSQYWTRETPEMWVIGFPHVRRGQRKAKRVEDIEGVELIVNNPYTDYKDFIKRNRNFLSWERGGYYFSKEEETEIDGVKVTQYEIAMEKLVNTKRAVIAWVYHYDDIDFAIQFKILDDHFKSYKRGFYACLKSFKRAERTKALPGSATTGKNIVEGEDLDKLSPEERKRALQDRVKRKYQREIDALPKGWKHRESEHYLMLYNCDEKFARRTLAHAEAVRDHLDKLFGDVGDRFVPKAIIRIFNTDAERNAYRNSTRSMWDEVQEIAVVQGAGWEKDWEYGYVNKGISRAWLYYRNRNLAMNMPSWLASGLGKYMEMLRTKGKRIDFTNENWDRDDMRMQIKKGAYVPLKELITSEIWSAAQQNNPAGSWERHRQAESVVYWLMTKGNRGKYKNLVKDYLFYLTIVVQDVQLEFEEKLGKLEDEKEAAMKSAQVDPDSEEEDEDGGGFDPEAHREELIKLYKEKRKEILEETFKRTFGKWSDRDWERFTKAWLSYAD